MIEDTEKTSDIIEIGNLIPKPPDAAIRIEPIMFFDMRTQEEVQLNFIGKDPVKFGHTTMINQAVLNTMAANNYKLVSTEKQGTIVYGIFQKI